MISSRRAPGIRNQERCFLVMNSPKLLRPCRIQIKLLTMLFSMPVRHDKVSGPCHPHENLVRGKGYDALISSLTDSLAKTSTTVPTTTKVHKVLELCKLQVLPLDKQVIEILNNSIK